VLIKCGRDVGVLCVFPTVLSYSFTLPQKSWITLLSVAHRYEFLNVRGRAIREIYGPFRAQQKGWDEEEDEEGEEEEEAQEESQQHDYQTLISVAEKYDVPLYYIAPLLVPFVVREQPLTVREVLRFSAVTVTRLAHAREAFIRESKSPKGWEINGPDAEEIVYRIWKIQNDD
jgi:hypothetical protein